MEEKSKEKRKSNSCSHRHIPSYDVLKKNSKKIFVILGPTSSGKTSLALNLCKDFNGEIISADSRQVVKYMDIGTGKVPVSLTFGVEKGEGCWVVDGVNIWGYDLVRPDDFFSGYNFAIFALKKSRELLKKGKNVFLVGGTGFYIDLFTGEAKPSKVIPDFALRESLEKLDLIELQKKLLEIDIDEYRKIDKSNKIRLIRAIEKSVSKNLNVKDLPYLKDCDFVFIGLNAPRNVLYEKADHWVESIWGSVLVEVKEIRNLGFSNSDKLHGLVYKTVLKYIDGNIDKKDALERIKFDIHGYIRRQQTWFKRKKNVTWIDISQDDFKEIIYNIVKENING